MAQRRGEMAYHGVAETPVVVEQHLEVGAVPDRDLQVGDGAHRSDAPIEAEQHRLADEVAGFELAGVSSTSHAFSSSYQFVTSLGWHWTHGLVQLRHISNAGLEGRNYGYTTLLAGVTFR